jgi:Ca2+-transporting ATPase
MPIHIAFLHLIIDPACSIVYEMEQAEPGAMARPPRDPREPLFGKSILVLSTLQGLGVLIMMLAVFGITLERGQGEFEARALAFTSLIVANLFLLLTNRSWTMSMFRSIRIANPALWWVIGGAVIFLGMVLTVPALRSLFRFSMLHPDDLLVCLSAGIFSVIWFEFFKKFGQRDF